MNTPVANHSFDVSRHYAPPRAPVVADADVYAVPPRPVLGIVAGMCVAMFFKLGLGLSVFLSFLAFSPFDVGIGEQIKIFLNGSRVPAGYLIMFYGAVIGSSAAGGYVALAVMRQPIKWAFVVLGLFLASVSPWDGAFGWLYLGSCISSISCMYLGILARSRFQARAGAHARTRAQTRVPARH